MLCTLVYSLCFLVFFVTIMPFFGLQACVGNYHKIRNTHVVTNNPAIYKNKGRHYFNAIICTLYSVRRIRTSITKELKAFSIYSRIGVPYGLLLHFPPLLSTHFPLLHFPLLHFSPLQFWPYRIFHSRVFSRPICSPSICSGNWNRLVHFDRRAFIGGPRWMIWFQL